MQQALLYTIVSADTLHEMLEAFHACMNLPIQVLDTEGFLLDSCGETSSYCRCFRRFLPPDEGCEKIHAEAGRKAAALGDSWLFSCPANLSCLVFPLFFHSNLLGSILAGPFLTDRPESGLITGLPGRFHIPTGELFHLYDELAAIRIIPPETVNAVSRLLYFLFSGLIQESKEPQRQNQEKMIQQSRIQETITRYQTGSTKESDTYPYELEKELIAKVKTGAKQEAKGVLNTLLGYVLFSGGSSLDILKARASELTTHLSRAVIESGASTNTILKLNNQFLRNFQQIDSMDTLCLKLQETVEAFTDSMFGALPPCSSQSIKKAVRYIAHHYAQPLTLEEVAGAVHLNPSYFSTLFKQSLGLSFREYLNLVRVEESKRLLAGTNDSIIDIAAAAGFENQSYFSKVFKKYTGMTPRQFR